MAATDAAPGFDIRHYLRILRRRRALISVTAIVIVVVAVLLSLAQTPTYEARSEIVFNSTPSALNGTANTVSVDPARDIQTQIAVMTGAQVRKLVATALHVSVAPNISASALLNANAVQLKATSTDPVDAVRVANAFANAYIDYRKSRTVSDLLDAEQLIEKRIVDLQHQIDDVTNQMSSAPAASRANAQATLGPQRDVLLGQQARSSNSSTKVNCSQP